MQANKAMVTVGGETKAAAAESFFESFFDAASGVWSLRRVSVAKKSKSDES